ncbi:putative membrane protein [Proteus phage vB_PmiP_Pm5460]|uniref:Putative membrane protein n=1 Tax=Proteus phage vB_PmiP_Pm5460 TaxID=1636249 RepID=A0A0G2SS16_9CAUD|nr:holin [Proteus phage vB_PmiP_Pm5460]AKA61858.1 putative membrane protein [Proteus phage vB_PmiP_Pm5460]
MRDKAGQAGDFKEWSNYDKWHKSGKGEYMKKIFKNKKVVGATVALILAILGTALGMEIGGEQAVTDIVCEVITCA